MEKAGKKREKKSKGSSILAAHPSLLKMGARGQGEGKRVRGDKGETSLVTYCNRMVRKKIVCKKNIDFKTVIS